MRLVQSVRSGELRLEPTTEAAPSPTQVLVETRASLISAGTERSLRSLASASLLSKARSRPDLVKQVIDRARSTGLRSTIRAVRSRLADDMPLGYSAAGVVRAVGEAVDGIRPGQRVATAGAPHADFQIVAGNLTAVMPDGVEFEHAAFSTLASIAFNGLRLTETGPGERIVVVGLGLVGQLTARLAAASGALVAGIEPDADRRALAERHGAAVFGADDEGWDAAAAWMGGRGADAVVVTAATESSQPLLKAAAAARDRGVLVLVGDAGMSLDRRPFYDRELTLRVARSYGPGRYDPVYEDLGIDYPPGYVRWTAQRNMEAFLAFLDAGRVDVGDLVTDRFPFSNAPDAYALLESDDRAPLGIVLQYDTTDAPPRPAPRRERPEPAPLDAGIVGTGRFARDVLIPAAAEAGFSFTAYHSVTGSTPSSPHLEGAAAAGDAHAVVTGNDGRVVFVATRHDTHAALVAEALRQGKHVFCEKPLAISESELRDVEEALGASAGSLMVGFNRRWSPAVRDAKKALGPGGPIQIVYRVNAGALPDGHWLTDRRMGGRLQGEGCHFVDTCAALVGSDATFVTTATSGRGELALDEDFTLLLTYPDGSQGIVVYASGSSTRPGKERIEILGRDRSIVIDDFATLQVDGPGGHKTTRYRPPDKGHPAELRAFAEVVQGSRDPGPITTSALATTKATLAAVESAMTGATARVP